MNPRMRSSDAPMDFMYTSRPSSQAKPVWASSGDDEKSTPKKRSHDALSPDTPMDPPTFGINQNIPFIFQTPAKQPESPYPWSPPPGFSSSRAFPTPAQQSEIRDVDMTEASPPKPEDPSPEKEKSESGLRMVATGALRRVYRARQKARGADKQALALRRNWESGSGSEVEEDIEDESGGRAVHKTSNHYTLNLPSPTPPRSDTPYVLLGYLQFFFNFSLVLIFFYLLVQFILTVQRDVEHRISEYSMDIVQEIAGCALQYKNNYCASPLPAMIHQCGLWETCMNRDPTKIGRARVGAELIAEVVNGFVEPITWKTLIFALTSLSFLTVFINTLLSLYRSKHRPLEPLVTAPPPAVHALNFPPYPSHQYGGYTASPNWGRSWNGGEEELETPSRRRRLEGGATMKIK
ncbi:hypothetical protein E1B28_009799 [Marasmius oreades]|uniref:Brl1/Brr6 domain-containing protein n=1 Tax=Marasmius oreades TaxID=181124 RepID=A0A9P7RW10_9AGAR|nr:uncharacterized protein E1B28_009799 [Marasmius oreades]KAG7090705.1 hypothetical protein E1B28_009799 [Marasmius oreades]